MEELEDLSVYNGNNEHDMWVDFTDYEYTGEPDEFDNDDNDLQED